MRKDDSVIACFLRSLKGVGDGMESVGGSYPSVSMSYFR